MTETHTRTRTAPGCYEYRGAAVALKSFGGWTLRMDGDAYALHCHGGDDTFDTLRECCAQIDRYLTA